LAIGLAAVAAPAGDPAAVSTRRRPGRAAEPVARLLDGEPPVHGARQAVCGSGDSDTASAAERPALLAEQAAASKAAATAATAVNSRSRTGYLAHRCDATQNRPGRVKWQA
jgi:hypothetical protein